MSPLVVIDTEKKVALFKLNLTTWILWIRYKVHETINGHEISLKWVLTMTSLPTHQYETVLVSTRFILVLMVFTIMLMSIPHWPGTEIDNVKINAEKIQDSVCIIISTDKVCSRLQVNVIEIKNSSCFLCRFLNFYADFKNSGKTFNVSLIFF